MKDTNSIEPAVATTAYREYHGGYFKTLVSPEQTGGSFALLKWYCLRDQNHLATCMKTRMKLYVLEGTVSFALAIKRILQAPETLFLRPAGCTRIQYYQ
ncbi:hypothetical protein [Chitinophaga pinensis]|uniref:Uncharacterized protein n=1 Tax=Chitinophaga pinensis TaxID=79329 RepID=A0A5C6LKX6_9BACT|nr:hypothetical protein [Chitinophaga pinensis]TWV89099.1 hypothetical protein FEF09_30145 [Chitinophaga pinensis]